MYVFIRTYMHIHIWNPQSVYMSLRDCKLCPFRIYGDFRHFPKSSLTNLFNFHKSTGKQNFFDFRFSQKAKNLSKTPKDLFKIAKDLFRTAKVYLKQLKIYLQNLSLRSKRV